MPAHLLALLSEHPSTKTWLVRDLGMLDLPSGALPVEQLSSDPVSQGWAKHLTESFNNTDCYTDAVLEVHGHAIHVHKFVIAHQCPALDTACSWGSGKKSVMLDVKCPVTGFMASYETVLAFLKYLYTGVITWPAREEQMHRAQGIVLLASRYQMPWILTEAEKALLRSVSRDNCCQLYVFCDVHLAERLKAYCEHCIRAELPMLQSTPDFLALPQHLRTRVATAL